VLAVVTAARAAHADHPKLDAARAAIAKVEYDRARGLLLDALRAGKAGPRELAELYRLSASTATVLGDRELAEQYYRRWLALDPSASLPAGIAPKLREPFQAAQAYMAAHGRLDVHASRDASDVEVVVASDPLTMIAHVALDAGGPLEPVTVDGAGHARLPVPAGATPSRVVALDDYGNVLVEIPASDFTLPDQPASPSLAPRPLRDDGPPLVRRPITWAIPTVAVTAVAIGFGLAARSADSDLENIVAHSNEHNLEDAESARARRDRDALVANVAFVAAGALAVATTVVYMTRPRSPARGLTTTTLVPMPAGGLGLAAAGTW
jgi:hypothetical protein